MLQLEHYNSLTDGRNVYREAIFSFQISQKQQLVCGRSSLSLVSGKVLLVKEAKVITSLGIYCGYFQGFKLSDFITRQGSRGWT